MMSDPWWPETALQRKDKNVMLVCAFKILSFQIQNMFLLYHEKKAVTDLFCVCVFQTQ